MATLRKRLRDSGWLTGALARLLAGYIRLCHRTNRWTYEGFDEIARALETGPVIAVTWHSRLVMSPQHLSMLRPFTAVHDTSPAGRLAGACQARFGMEAVAMAKRGPVQAANRQALQNLRAGMPIALAADGPKGPAHHAKAAALGWARVSGVPIFVYAFGCTRGWRLSSWDRLLIPRLFGRGHASFARWESDIPRRAGSADIAALQTALSEALTAHQAAVDETLGMAPAP